MNYMSKVFDPNNHTTYKPANPLKYKGQAFPICRSSWERKFCFWCDTNENVLEWASEAIEIPYMDPVTKKTRRYYPDFYIKVKDKDGNVQRFIIEIKPKKETRPPVVRSNRKPAQILKEKKTYITNQAKWATAMKFCERKGIQFKILTEEQLFG